MCFGHRGPMHPRALGRCGTPGLKAGIGGARCVPVPHSCCGVSCGVSCAHPFPCSVLRQGCVPRGGDGEGQLAAPRFGKVTVVPFAVLAGPQSKVSRCQPNEHNCLGTELCIHMSKLCNGLHDCFDGSDEGPHCRGRCWGWGGGAFPCLSSAGKDLWVSLWGHHEMPPLLSFLPHRGESRAP